MARKAGLVLASASAARRRLLAAAGVTFEVLPAKVDEGKLREAYLSRKSKLPPEDIALRLARAKAEWAARRRPKAIVIGADQVLAADFHHQDRALEQSSPLPSGSSPEQALFLFPAGRGDDKSNRINAGDASPRREEAGPKGRVRGRSVGRNAGPTALISKARDLGEARDVLRALRGRGHELHSAVVVRGGTDAPWEHVATARLRMRKFSDEFLEDYLDRDGGEALASVGCYRVEDRGIQLFERVDGDHSVILGLPLLPLLAELRRRGVLPQ